jgi:hypothetical protein
MLKAVATAGALLLVSCGGGKGVAGGSFTTSVPAGKPVNTLTADEQATLCSDLIAFRLSLNAELCLISAYVETGFTADFTSATDESLRMTCSNIEEMCLSPADAGAGTTPPKCGGVSSPACVATVAEVSTCVSALKVGYDRQASTLPSCSTVAVSSFPDGGLATTPADRPPICQRLDEECPGFFSSWN